MQTYVFEKHKERMGSVVHTINCKKESWTHHPIAEPQTSRTIITSETLSLEQIKHKAFEEDAKLIPLRVCKDCLPCLAIESA